MSLIDLQEALRSCQVTNFDEVQYAIVETTGKMSVVMKKESSPITMKDLKLNAPESTFPIIIVDEGKFNKDNLELSGLSEEYIIELAKKKLNIGLKEILVLNIDNAGKVYLQSKKGNAITFKIEFDGGKNW